MSTEIVEVPAEILYKLVFDYDNTNNTAEFEHKYTTKYEVKLSSKRFTEEISKITHESMEKIGVSADASVSYGPVEASVSGSYDSVKTINDQLEKTIRGESEENVSKFKESSRTYTIGAKSRVVLYQQCFSVPGLSIDSDVFVSKGAPLESLSQSVTIRMKVKKLEFIEYIGVSAGSNQGEKPKVRVREINGKNDDINAGFSGKYISLIPVYTTDKNKAATGFDFIAEQKQSEIAFEGFTMYAKPGREPLPEAEVAANKERAAQGKPLISDLAEGAGGLYRFLLPVVDPRVPFKITEVALMRSGEGVSLSTVKALGYSGRSDDLNNDRSGDYLYVLWKSQQVA